MHAEHLKDKGSRKKAKSKHISQRIKFFAYWGADLKQACGKAIKKVENRCQPNHVGDNNKIAFKGGNYTNAAADQVTAGKSIRNVFFNIQVVKGLNWLTDVLIIQKN